MKVYECTNINNIFITFIFGVYNNPREQNAYNYLGICTKVYCPS